LSASPIRMEFDNLESVTARESVIAPTMAAAIKAACSSVLTRSVEPRLPRH